MYDVFLGTVAVKGKVMLVINFYINQNAVNIVAQVKLEYYEMSVYIYICACSIFSFNIKIKTEG